MILSDVQIRTYLEKGSLVIDPLDRDSQIQPASVDVRLASSFKVSRREEDDGAIVIDGETNVDRNYTEVTDVGNDGVTLRPGDFALAETKEWFEFPDNLVGKLRGRSSIGRLGVQVHSTAGLLDPGFRGTVTLELSVTENDPVTLVPGIRIGQVTIEEMAGPSAEPYGFNRGSKYQDQRGPTSSRIHEDED